MLTFVCPVFPEHCIDYMINRAFSLFIFLSVVLSYMTRQLHDKCESLGLIFPQPCVELKLNGWPNKG